MIRKAKETDYEAIKVFCKDNNIDCPSNSQVLLVDVEGEKIIGLIGLKQIYQVEPLISTKYKTTYDLTKMLDGICVFLNIPELEITCDKKHKDLYEDKFNFQQINEDKIRMRKTYG